MSLFNMEKSNETSLYQHSSDQVSGAPGGQAPAPTLVYLIELDPSVSTCLAGGSLPLQMLNTNHSNTHYLIPIQGPESLEIPQQKELQHNQETQELPSSRDVRVESKTVSTNGNETLQCNQSKARNLEDSLNVKGPTVYGSHLGDSKCNINGTEQTSKLVTVDQNKQTTTKSLPMGPLQPQLAADVGRPACNYVHVADSVPPPRAVLSLPAALRLRAGRVSPRRLLPPARFGPVRGVERDVLSEAARELVVKAAASSKPVFLLSKGESFCHIDVSDQEKSNWFSLLPLGTMRTANLWLEQCGDKLFAVSTRRLPPRTPLSLGYSAPAARLRLPPAIPVLGETNEEQRVSNCAECGLEMDAAPHECPAMFKSSRLRRRYRCKYCAMPFARVFTLKRHVSLHCKSKATKTISRAEPEPPSDVFLSVAAEEERVSDESFNNISLDFSTNLFDPDRMPLDPDRMTLDTDRMPLDPDRMPLDLASNLGKDDSLLGQSPPDTTCTSDIYSPLDYSKKVPKTTNSIKCHHCQLTMTSNMKRRHKRQCTARRVSCACGETFRDRERLDAHLLKDHAPPPSPIKGDTDSTGSSYKCEQCQNTFKRRGMLVNHVWRVHGAAAHVPLQRRTRHYPCGACPKLYRTAAKRDRHVRTHHPGAEPARAAIIESGAVWMEAAACPACPRQYATRAKLLQHMRAAHPALAPPSKSRQQKQANNDLSLSYIE